VASTVEIGIHAGTSIFLVENIRPLSVISVLSIEINLDTVNTPCKYEGGLKKNLTSLMGKSIARIALVNHKITNRYNRLVKQ
jgi:hypothetical protein